MEGKKTDDFNLIIQGLRRLYFKWEKKYRNRNWFGGGEMEYDFEIPEGKASKDGYQEFVSISIALVSPFLKIRELYLQIIPSL